MIGVPALAASYALEPIFGLIALIYLASMLLYSVSLKKLALIDVFTISAGFVLRAVAGAVVIDSPISPWLYICTGAGSGLRRALQATERACQPRVTRPKSSAGFWGLIPYPVLDQLITVAASSALVSYTLYTVASEEPAGESRHAPDGAVRGLTACSATCSSSSAGTSAKRRRTSSSPTCP